MLCAVEGDYTIADLHPVRLCCSAWSDFFEHMCRWLRNAVHQRTDKRYCQGGQNIHNRPGDCDQDLLPAGPEHELILDGDIASSLPFDRSVGLVATQFHITAKRDRR